MANYDILKGLAFDHKYTSFTALQECAFSNSNTYDEKKDLFVIGETSSGKTLIPLLLYGAAVKEAVSSGSKPPKMLFVVPYRALAAQKENEISSFFEAQGLKIAQSTGEYRQDDEAIQKGEIDVAIVITEKVYKYEARDSSFLSLYDYLVLDEVGLVDSLDRGTRLDFIFAWARNQHLLTGRPRIIALGTPSYDWSAYINSYGFYPIQVSDRPVELSKINVVYDKDRRCIYKVEGQCNFLYPMCMISQQKLNGLIENHDTPTAPCDAIKGFCPIQEPARNDPTQLCPNFHTPCTQPMEFIPDGCGATKYILLKICREHLAAGHQILIFMNDRERVKALCTFLYQSLQPLLSDAPSAEICREEILACCDLKSEDLYGILEHENGPDADLELYRAFKCGVGFHSAALPNELRTYVERCFLNSRTMKIVCSTETLAFGVNSAVDVVVVADIYKHENFKTRPLTLNEYQNYAGRAGRLRRDINAAKTKGYVYTLITRKKVQAWEEMNRNAKTPERLYSQIYGDSDERLPFFLMNLLPTNNETGLPVTTLVEMVSSLPQDGSVVNEDLDRKIRTALDYLIQNNLAVLASSRPKGRRQVEPVELCCLTPLGSRLRGFTLGKDDFQKLLEALNEYVDGIFSDENRVTFLFRLLQTKHAESGLNSIFSGSETRQNIRELRRSILSLARSNDHSLAWLEQCQNERLLSILAAILAWSEGASAKTLYRQFGIHYALLSKLAEQIGYLIEIAAEILPYRMERIWLSRQSMYQEMQVSDEVFLKQVDTKLESIHDLFVSVYYGVNTSVAIELLDFLRSLGENEDDPDPVAAALADELSLKYINPSSARKLRRITTRYLFFKDPPAVDWTDTGARNNYLNQRWQYNKDIEEMDPHIGAFFRASLGEDFANSKEEVSV